MMKWVILIMMMCTERVIKIGWEGEEEEEQVVTVLTESSVNPLPTSRTNLSDQFGIMNQQIVRIMVNADGSLNVVSSIFVKPKGVYHESLRLSPRAS